MTIEERVNKILRGCISPLCGLRYDEANTVRSELTQFFLEIKKRCMEECEKVEKVHEEGAKMYFIETGIVQGARDCIQAIDRMEIE